ncbi:toxin-activating lysine-acyltransferase [Caulobacter soli]|uniref:toxin-activating lysine-acyltransferase n=1 Tax=Caulobacter soli TaxID=2708539 RepID=UPI0013EC577E|nr:toxin-activating lysine-acyltransferase [Caulobacter soli]
MTEISGSPSHGAIAVTEVLGQIVWLLEQSPLHRELKIKDLSWSIMPAVTAGQFRLFRFGPTPGFDAIDPAGFVALGLDRESLERLPLGLGLWAWLTPEAEAKLESGTRLDPADWSGGETLWLLELISPFATPQNKLLEFMLLDLIDGPFAGRRFNMHRTDPVTGLRTKVMLGGEQPFRPDTGAS